MIQRYGLLDNTGKPLLLQKNCFIYQSLYLHGYNQTVIIEMRKNKNKQLFYQKNISAEMSLCILDLFKLTKYSSLILSNRFIDRKYFQRLRNCIFISINSS